MVLIILLLPETLRSIAGNGTIKLGLIHRPLWWMFKSRDSPFNPTTDALSCRPSLAALAEPFKCLKQKNLVASIIFGSVIYAVWTAVLITTTLLFEPRLHTSTLLVGLAFLPSGAGSVMSFYLTGYIMDRDYSIVETRYRESHNVDQNSTVDPKSSANFPIYRARLRSLWWLALIFIIATSGYGFSFLSPSVAAPLVLQFFVAFTATAVLFLNGVLVANIYPGPSASVIAIMNLIRFSCGALVVGTVQLLFTRLGFGFTFLTLAMIALAFMPILLVQWVFATERKSETVSWWRWPSRFTNFD
jgi:MFS family permease